MLSIMLSDNGYQWESGQDLKEVNYFKKSGVSVAYNARISKLVSHCPASYYKRLGNRVYDFTEVLDLATLYKEV